MFDGVCFVKSDSLAIAILKIRCRARAQHPRLRPFGWFISVLLFERMSTSSRPVKRNIRIRKMQMRNNYKLYFANCKMNPLPDLVGSVSSNNIICG